MFYFDVLLLVFTLLRLKESHCKPIYPESLSLPEFTYESRNTNYTDDITRAKLFLLKFDRKAESFQLSSGEANWNYETDLTDEHLKKVIEVGEEVSSFYLQSSNNASFIKTLDLPNDLSRQIRLIKRSAEPPQKELRMDIKKLIGEMTKVFGSSKVQHLDKNSSTLVNLTQTDISDLFKSSRNVEELNWAWQGWRDAVGPKIKHHFSSVVDLLNIGAREHGWIDYGDFLRREYEMSDLEEVLDKVWTEIEPLYKELHAYVRFKLSKVYNISGDGCIPASLLGDLYAQNWENVFEIVKPSEKSRTFDVTEELRSQRYTVKKMFELAESFFTSIGLEKMPDTFWERSILTKQKEKEMVCHASAWDVGRKDVRIKMCTKITQKDLTTIHHEMGHIEYFLAYRNQPTVFRAGGNPGFHEAIGDTISLSVETPDYLKKVGLLKNFKMKGDDETSFLLNQALRRVAPIPYNLLVDKWRWRVFEGNISDDMYNKAWWDLRVKYQGVEAPVFRPADAFDPASKYHIGANVPYIPYFISYVLQFQFHKRLCSLSGHKGPLYKCSIQNSKEAGQSFRKLLAAGRSRPWPKLLQSFSGEKTLKATAILEYFEPLKEWLSAHRGKHKYPLGWKDKTSKVDSSEGRTQRFANAQERSGISKSTSDNKDDKATLSFNIPPDALKELLKTVQDGNKQNTTGASQTSNNAETQNADNNANNKQPNFLDISGLLSGSGNQLSIKSTDSSEEIKNDVDTGVSNQTITKNTGQSVDNTNKQATVEGAPLMSTENVGSSDETGNSESNKTSNEQTISINKNALLAKLVNLLDNKTGGSGKTGENEHINNKESVSNEKETSTSKDPKAAGNTTEGKPTTVSDTSSNSQNQIALVPVKLPAKVLSNLKKPQQENKTSAVVPLKDVDNYGTDKIISLADANKPYDTKMASKSPAEDSKVYTEDEKKKNLTSAQTPSITREDLKQLLKASLENQTSKTSENQNPLKDNNANSQAINTKEEPKGQTMKAVEEGAAKDISNKILELLVNPKQNLSSQYAYLNLPNNKKELGNKTSSEENSDKNTNEEITSDLKKLLGIYNITNPSVAKEKEGEKFIQTVESCKKFHENDPSCMLGKTIIESQNYPSSNKAGIDESKQTVSISPSLLVQKLMEHKKAKDSTPDAVVNNVRPLNTTKSNIETLDKDNTSTLDSNTENKDSDQPNLDPKTLLNLLSTALNQNKPQTASSSKRGNEFLSSENKTNMVDNYTSTENTKHRNCSLLIKRDFSINFNCNSPISNRTQLTGRNGVPVPTAELLRNLMHDKQIEITERKSLPPAHLQKTANGFQVKFDLHVKDQIPTEVSGTLKTLSSGRQQHVNIYNTPQGMFMKPKSSIQLLMPSFVPVHQNEDNIELGKIDSAEKQIHL